MDQQKIIMTFSTPPMPEDMEVIARAALDNLPEEIMERCEELEIVVEELPDEAVEQELDLDDPYDLLALYRSGKEITPGVERKVAQDDDVLILYRRPILDLWCETGEDLALTIRNVMIEELGTYFEFSEDDIEEMSARHYQGMF
jgi:predicted Zn-dependent protease with MMP-like domain